jgi:stress response protein YsnF
MAHEKIVTAFNQEQQAQVAREKLIAEGIAEKNIDIISGERLRVEDKEIRHPSFWQRIFGTDVDESYASEYNRALQTGGVLLTVRVSQEEAGNVEMLLDQYSSDYSSLTPNAGQGTDREFLGETDDRLSRGPGGSYETDKNDSLAATLGGTPVTGKNDSLTGTSGSGYAAGKDDPLTTTSGGGYMADTDDRLSTGADSLLGTEKEDRFATDEPLLNESVAPVGSGGLQRDDEHEGLTLAEEEVEIGKRQVSDGFVRLRRYTVEESVSEDISLYDQHAEVFRHAIDEPTYLNDVDWSDKTISVEESHEIPVVSKTAHIREEVGVRSEGTERVETVKDSVRRQEVEVEKESSTDHDLTRLDDDRK